MRVRRSSVVFVVVMGQLVGCDTELPPEDCTDLTLPAITAEELVPGHVFNLPVFLTQPEGSTDLYVVLQAGRIELVRGTTVTTFLDISARTNSSGERGLLGLAFHPDYASNGRFFISYTPLDPDHNRIAEYRRNSANPDVADDAEVAVLVSFDDPEANHNGGMIAFGPDGYLYAGMGDGGGGGDAHGEFGNGLDLQTPMGKILRLDVDDAAASYAAAGNPFAATGGLPQIWAYGLRNPWRFSFDRLRGDLYIGDVGQNQWEEIDFQPASSPGGENYGWRAYEGNAVYSEADLGRVPVHAAPIHVYPHATGSEVLAGGCSVTGGYVYRGSAIPGLEGWYLFGDFCNARRGALRMCSGTVMGVSEVPGLEGVIQNLVAFGEDQAGELYVMGINSVLRIVPAI